MAAIDADWFVLPPAEGQPPLRCWWARPLAPGWPRGAVLLLPEVFGINSWVRAVAERLAGEGYGVLVLPLFARTAPDLELGYDETALALGRQHRDQVSASGVLDDARRAIAWLQQQPGLIGRPVACLGFCFGGHLALHVATLAAVALTCDIYGARVSNFCPGGGSPTLTVVPRIPGDLLCLCGDQDPLMPSQEREAIAAALQAAGSTRRRELVVLPGAGHGFLCDQRADYHPAAAAQAWDLVLEALAQAL
ncbi:MAG: dienelactone hydrolase family protein [Cyanobacteriota bacterium]|nr:dienelactone hydrolase family protein [Cyanobacteriota bacterium]